MQRDKASAVQEAEVWQQNAASWAQSILQQHPLYQDLLQPLALAVGEVRYGLSLMISAATRRADQDSVDAAIADCLTFPSSLGQGMLVACSVCTCLDQGTIPCCSCSYRRTCAASALRQTTGSKQAHCVQRLLCPKSIAFHQVAHAVKPNAFVC